MTKGKLLFSGLWDPTTFLGDSKSRKKWEAVRLLLNYGADPRIRNHIGRFALKYAIRNGDNRIARLFGAVGSPEGVWNPRSSFLFVRKRVDEPPGKLGRFFKWESCRYPDGSEKSFFFFFAYSGLSRRFITLRCGRFALQDKLWVPLA